MDGHRILLVEDSPGIHIMVQSAIEDIGALTCVTTVAGAEQELSHGLYTLLILDIDLPDGDGFDFCKKIRSRDRFQNLPIIFFTGKADIDQLVMGFSLGADDYIVKPIEPKEFKARVESKLKRHLQSVPLTTFRKSDFVIDLAAHRISVAFGNTETELKLTPIEFKLLVHFLRNEGVVISRDELLMAIWGDSVHVSAHTIDTHIYSLRKKIAFTGHHLKAVTKKGYCFSIKSGPLSGV
ncbi:MAG: response regulator transcription factor [Bdellovibrionaceae bacterium]|nr:response regulator transcription factor [Pseudobdellovibrionaceae bacterium]